jgi:hypothetical protein
LGLCVSERQGWPDSANIPFHGEIFHTSSVDEAFIDHSRGNGDSRANDRLPWHPVANLALDDDALAERIFTSNRQPNNWRTHRGITTCEQANRRANRNTTASEQARSWGTDSHPIVCEHLHTISNS